MRIIESTELRQLCLDTAAKHGARGMDAALFIGDYDYVLPTEDSVRAFGKRFMDFLFSSNLNKYAEERNDCDDYAQHAASFAKIDHARHFLGEQALAFGVAWIATDTLLHAVNIAVHAGEDGKPYLRLCEPQVTWNDRNTIGQPYMSLREFDISSVRLWQLVCF